MDRVVPWRVRCERIEPVYPKAGTGRPSVGVERMLRMYLLQHWFNLSDPAVEEALYDSLLSNTQPMFEGPQGLVAFKSNGEEFLKMYRMRDVNVANARHKDLSDRSRKGTTELG